MCRLLACLALTAFAGTAAACLNDIELPTHEREFRSQYRGPKSPPPSPSPSPTKPVDHPLLLGVGATLLLGATALVLSGGRRKE